jgi:nucleoside-diphosphate-sugar epimerase
MAQRVLLTGHNGYIGAVLGPFLQAYGQVVVGLDTGYFRECSFGPATNPIPCVWKDIRDIDLDFLRRSDAVVHLASISAAPAAVNPVAVDSVNRKATTRLARLARKAGVKRFVFASSDRGTQRGNNVEAMSQQNEAAIHELATDTFAPVCLRIPQVFGVSPQFRADLPLNRLVCDSFLTGRVALPDSEARHISAIHVEDAAAAFANALVAPLHDIRANTFSLGSEQNVVSYRAIANALRQTMPDVSIGAEADSPAPAFEPSAPRAQTVMPGCRPQWSLHSGVRQIVDAFCRHGFAPEDGSSRRFDRAAQLAHLIRTGDVQPDMHWKRNFGEEIATWAA